VRAQLAERVVEHLEQSGFQIDEERQVLRKRLDRLQLSLRCLQLLRCGVDCASFPLGLVQNAFLRSMPRISCKRAGLGTAPRCQQA
jgi:hypothetical protein